MTTIKLKNGSGAPLAGDLVQGEPALDLTNKRLYTEDSGGTVIEVGTNPSTINIDAGTIDGTVIGGSTPAAGSFTTFTSTGIDDNAASTAITIDGSQNLLVSKTSTGVGTAGLELRADGLLAATRSGSNVGVFRRLTDDGSIIDFQNSGGTTVGSIANRGTNLSVGSGDVALEFNASNDAVLPASTSTNNTRDAAVDLGISSVRFKDLHMSGTANVGGITSDGNISMSGAGTGSRYVLLGNETSAYAGSLVMQAGGGSAAYGGSIIAYGHSHASKAGDIVAGISSGSGGAFRVNTSGIDSGGDVLVVEASGNVGIGTSSPSGPLDVHSASGDTNLYVTTGNTAASTNIFFGDSGNSTIGRIVYDHTGDYMKFRTNGSDAMRLDSSGNLLVGKTATGIGTVGAELKSTGELLATVNNDACAFLNRKSSDGDIIQLRKDGTTVGSIGSRAGNLFTTYTSNGYGLTGTATSNAVIPSFNGATSDNAVDLGGVAVRFDDIYATNGTIQTSDRNEKQDIEALSDAEQRVAVACKGLLRKFRWIDSVEEKGRRRTYPLRYHCSRPYRMRLLLKA
jgi:hypothetical protein